MNNAYEGLIKLMREQGAVNNSAEIKIGIMTGADSLKIGDLALDKDDLIFAEHLIKPVITKLDFTIDEASTDPHSHTWKDKSEYIKPLKKGDIVTVTKIDDDTYAVLERMVSIE